MKEATEESVTGYIAPFSRTKEEAPQNWTNMKPQTSLHGQSKCEDNYDGLRVFNWDRPAFLSNHCYTLTLLHTRTSNKTTIKVSKNESSE